MDSPSQTDNTLHLLLVDDDAVDRMAVRRAIARANLASTVVEVDCVAAAIQRIDAERFDVILLDFYLPGGDGLDVLDHLTARGVSTPVVVLTGQGDELLVASIMKRGASDYLPKSQVSPDRIRKGVVDAIRTRDLELRERSARSALARQALRLRALTEAGVRILATPGTERMVENAAREALSLFNVRGVTVEYTGRGGSVVRCELPSPDHPEGEATLATPLEASPGVARGRVALRGPEQHAFDDNDELLLDQFARLLGVGLENTRLLAEAREATRSRDDVLAVVSHDLRSPLGTVVLGAAMLNRSLSKRAPELQGELETVQRVERGCKRMQRLIDDLLAVARLDAGTFRVDARALRAADVVGEAIDAAQLHAQAAGIKLRAEVADPSIKVHADRERLLQVFANLLGNALTVTPRGGEVVVSTRATPEGTAFTVRDTGPGIPAEQLPHLFDRYWQGDQSSRGSAGLGLYIVRGVVEAHGGRVAVTTEPGQGTEFTLLFPSAR